MTEAPKEQLVRQAKGQIAAIDHAWTAYSAARHTLTERNRELVYREAVIAKQVLTEARDQKTNAEERKTELTLRLHNDPDYSRTLAAIDSATEQRDSAEQALEIARYTFRLLQQQIGLIREEMFVGSV
jgi:hypothetical protein